MLSPGTPSAAVAVADEVEIVFEAIPRRDDRADEGLLLLLLLLLTVAEGGRVRIGAGTWPPGIDDDVEGDTLLSCCCWPTPLDPLLPLEPLPLLSPLFSLVSLLRFSFSRLSRFAL